MTGRPIPVFAAGVSLRALEPEDLDWLYRLENDPDLWAVGADAMHYSRHALRRYVAEQPKDFFQAGELRLAIVAPGFEEPAGLIDLTARSMADGRAEIGIGLRPDCRGRGIGTAALHALEQYAAGHLRLRLLYALVSAVHNEASRRLFSSAGYAEVALLPRWHRCNGGFEDMAVFQKLLPDHWE